MARSQVVRLFNNITNEILAAKLAARSNVQMSARFLWKHFAHLQYFIKLQVDISSIKKWGKLLF
jgi:oligoribonuclease (3'-5' exoribonuclease)